MATSNKLLSHNLAAPLTAICLRETLKLTQDLHKNAHRSTLHNSEIIFHSCLKDTFEAKFQLIPAHSLTSCVSLRS
jgi:hypothetical protein